MDSGAANAKMPGSFGDGVSFGHAVLYHMSDCFRPRITRTPGGLTLQVIKLLRFFSDRLIGDQAQNG